MYSADNTWQIIDSWLDLAKLNIIKLLVTTFRMRIAITIALACYIILSNIGCRNKPYSEVDARLSADWVKSAIIYEVYLRSFSKEGTFKALETRVDELKNLGVTVFCLMPIHPIGELNRRGQLGNPYSIRDYYSINPEYGSFIDFKSLVNTIHRQGLKIIIDLVVGYTAWDSQLLMEHPEWFIHNDEDALISPNSELVDVASLNYDHHELRKYMIAMMKYWVRDVGIDGFRCCSAELVPMDFWNIVRKELDKIKPVMMISDDTLPEYHVKAFDLTYSWNIFNVFGKVMKGSAPVRVFDDILKIESHQYPHGSLILRFDNDQDKNIEDAVGTQESTPEEAKTTAIFLFSYPGIPKIFNGEEVGNRIRLSLFNKIDIDWSKGGDFRQLYRRLGTFRCDHPAMSCGTYVSVWNSDSMKVFSIIRTARSDTVLVVINFSHDRKKINVKIPIGSSMTWKEYFTDRVLRVKELQLELSLSSLGYALLTPTLREKFK